LFGKVPGCGGRSVPARPIQVGVAVLAPDERGRPGRVLSLGELTRDKVTLSWPTGLRAPR